MRFPGGTLRTLFAAALIFACGGCTHLLETRVDALPERMQFEDFSFARPTGDGWYMTNAPADFTYAEFKKRTESSEAMIRVVQMSPSDIIENEEQLLTYANNLPGEDPIIRLEAGHGATCVRYRGRSALTVNYEENTAGQYQNRMVTDEDSLECIDPDRPGSLFAFTYSERSKAGGSQEGLHEADEFIKSIQFISAAQSSVGSLWRPMNARVN